MAVLVTGATGLIGQHLVASISDPVFAASRAGTVPARSEGNVRGVEFDVRDDTSIETLPWSEIDAIVHLAGYTEPRGSVDKPHKCFETNASGTSALLTAASESAVDAFLYVSSYWVYDPNVTGRIDESVRFRVETPYGASKAAAEFQCDAFRAQTDMAMTTLRPFNVYGPGARPHQVVPEFVSQAINEGVIKPHPGNPVRDFLYVGDLTEAIEQCLSNRPDGAFNIGRGSGTSIHELAETVRAVVEDRMGTQVCTDFTGDPSPTDPKIADISKLKTRIDWEPTTALKPGIDRLVTRYLETHDIES